jgi:hypothetical protein
MSDLERELESELHRVLDPMSATPIPPRRAVQSHGTTRALLKGAGAALSIKLLTGVAVAAAAVTVAGVATTGSLNPGNWGERVTTQVSNCKAQLSDGQHGIGDCVSGFSSQHGAAVASAARHHGNGNGDGNATSNGNGNGNGNANGHAKDKPKSNPPGPKSQTDAPPTIEPEPVDQAGTHQPVRITPQP